MATKTMHPPEFKAAAVARVKAGEKPAQVGKELKLNGSMVAKWVREAKGKPAPKAKGGGKPGKYSAETKAMALARVRAGESQAAVQRDMKLGHGMVSYWVRHDKGAPVAHVNGNGAGPSAAVLDAIVFLKRAKKEIHKRAARGEAGVDDPIALLSMLALSTLTGNLA